MRVCLILPTQLLERFNYGSHMVLAQVYMAYPEYRDFYRRESRRGSFIILDNGAAELGRSISEEELLSVALDLKPTYVVAPDSIYKADETQRRTNRFVSKYAEKLRRNGIRIMAVPQGDNLDEYLRLFDDFNNNPDIAWLGISKFYEPKLPGGRLQLLKTVASRAKKPLHLLGVWDDPYKVRLEKAFINVVSVDTAKPVSLGLQGLSLLDWDRRRCRDSDYFERCYYLDEVLPIIERNIREFLDICK